MNYADLPPTSGAPPSNLTVPELDVDNVTVYLTIVETDTNCASGVGSF